MWKLLVPKFVMVVQMQLLTQWTQITFDETENFDTHKLHLSSTVDLNLQLQRQEYIFLVSLTDKHW